LPLRGPAHIREWELDELTGDGVLLLKEAMLFVEGTKQRTLPGKGL
jgi:hypothetical protein